MTTPVLACLALVSVLGAAQDTRTSVPADAFTRSVTVTVSPTRWPQPGDVLLLTVRTSEAAEAVSGTTPGGQVVFRPTAEPLVWTALTGIDLAAPRGPYRVDIRVTMGGAVAVSTVTLTVRTRRFEERQLRVETKFASPSAAERERIERENKRLQAVLAAVSGERHWDGPFVAPVPGASTSGFGRVSVINGERRSPHVGADFRAATGTPVRAPNAGRVVLSDDLFVAGQAVVIDHGGGVYSLLAHLSERRVADGHMVRSGDVVGLSGATGRVTGPHLHWTARIGTARVDPERLMRVLAPAPSTQPEAGTRAPGRKTPAKKSPVRRVPAK